MEVYGIIYTLIDGTNDKEYIGQTTRTFADRFYQHVHGDLYIDRVIQKHGADLFATAILQICYSQEELDYWEKRLIKSRDTMSPNGYNLIEGGIGTTGKNNPFFGKRHMAESIARMSESHRGNRNFTKKDIAKLEEIFGLPAEYLMALDDD